MAKGGSRIVRVGQCVALTVSILALVLSPSCGGVTQSGRVGADDRRADDPPADGPARPVYEALCRYHERCAPRALEHFPGGTLEDCVDYVACAAGRQGIVLQHDAPAAEIGACVDWLEARDCGVGWLERDLWAMPRDSPSC